MDPDVLLAPHVLPYLVILACVAMACGTVLILVPREATKRALHAFADAIWEQERYNHAGNRRRDDQIEHLTGTVTALAAEVHLASKRVAELAGAVKALQRGGPGA